MGSVTDGSHSSGRTYCHRQGHRSWDRTWDQQEQEQVPEQLRVQRQTQAEQQVRTPVVPCHAYLRGTAPPARRIPSDAADIQDTNWGQSLLC